jgi:hypothetical protein
VEHDQGVGHGQGLVIIGRGQKKGVALVALHAPQLGPQLDPQLGVQARQGLVQQEEPGAADQCPAQGDALFLPAAHGLGQAAQDMGDVQGLGQGLHPLLDGPFALPLDDQGRGDVRVAGLVRIEGQIVEDHGHLAMARLPGVHRLAVEQDVPLVRAFEPGDGAQDGGLARAGRSQEDGQGGLRHHEIHPGEGLVFAEALGDPGHLQDRGSVS